MRRLLPVLLAACSNAVATPDAALDVVDDAAADDAPTVDASPPLAILVVNEVAPGEAPDWIEVVNASAAAVQLADYCYVDVAGDLAKCAPFAAMMLAPGAYHAQDVDDLVSGFRLGGDEELWVYRIADQRLSDGVDWDEGAAPTGTSYRRVPDTTGAFATGAQSKGAAN